MHARRISSGFGVPVGLAGLCGPIAYKSEGGKRRKNSSRVGGSVFPSWIAVCDDGETGEDVPVLSSGDGIETDS